MKIEAKVGRPKSLGGGMMAACLKCGAWRLRKRKDGYRLCKHCGFQAGRAHLNRSGPGAPVPAILHCMRCARQHIDAGEWATRPHRTHLCEACGHTWRPANVPTVGVRELPGPKDESFPEISYCKMCHSVFSKALGVCPVCRETDVTVEDQP